ncbi:MAG: mannose-1-phosphate guanylyltransferase/mannose-6-phosphate isomerase [Thiohalomonadales bacterium]
MNIQPVILSGGSGTRLWPLSRSQYPKQLLNLLGEYSLLQETVSRLKDFEPAILHSTSTSADPKVLSPLIVCNEEHRFLVAEQLRQINQLASQIILEPIGRNTAPALTLAALSCERDGQEDILLVMPADHVIRQLPDLYATITLGYQQAVEGALVTFGIVPDCAETGYGYIRTGGDVGSEGGVGKVKTIAGFVEKPDQTTAEAYLASGEYLWNSGMFMMKASSWLHAIKKQRRDIYDTCTDALAAGQKDLDFFRVDKAIFNKCASDSIDYAVMEKLATLSIDDRQGSEPFGAVVPMDAGWSDVGAWSSLWDVSEKDREGNVCHGDVITHNSADSYIHAEHRLVAAVGLQNIVIVETADAVMVADKDNAQDVKHIVDVLKSKERTESIIHRQVYRPWGSYEGVVAGPRFQVKRIEVNPGACLSLQMHHHRAEHWIVVSGTAKVTRGEETFLLSENESTYIPLGMVHRLENPGSLILEIIEVQSGSYLGEDDIVRFEDNYGRSES